MKKRISAILIIVCFAFVSGIVFLFLYKKETPFSISSTEFELTPYFVENEYYVFIPSEIYDDLCIKSSSIVKCDDDIINNKPISCFKLNYKYEFELKNKIIYVTFLMNNNTSLFVNGSFNMMKQVNSSKKNKANVLITSFKKDGSIENKCINAILKGRGNSSWNREKKPYNLIFNQNVSFLEMKSSKKWILVSNCLDSSNLNNKIVYDFCNELDFEWTPNCEYINLYINGEYNGLYLLCENIELQEDKISGKTNVAIFKREATYRLSDLKNGFLTNHDIAIEITDNVKNANLSSLKVIINEAEDVLLSGSEECFENTFDLESWAKLFLIDELFDNFDSAYCSTYFYVKNDGKIYRGPVWDYDNIMVTNPGCVSCFSYYRKPGRVNMYFYFLQYNSFYENIKKLYLTKFLPIIDDYINNKILLIEKQIGNDVYMDSIRWNYAATNENKIISFIKKKSETLEYYFKNKDELAIIQIDNGNKCYDQFLAQVNTPYREMLEINKISNEDNYSFLNGDIVDKDSSITDNVVMVKNINMDTTVNSSWSLISSIGIVNLSFITVLFALFLFFILKYK